MNSHDILDLSLPVLVMPVLFIVIFSIVKIMARIYCSYVIVVEAVCSSRESNGWKTAVGVGDERR
jgi:hypothetical protein